MKFIADFHLHSKYSRATSKDMDLEHLAQWAKWKGIKLLGSGDFTHPLWLNELKRKLTPTEDGLFKYNDTNFILTTEVNNIFSQNGKGRKVHNIIFTSSFEAADRINRELGRIANLMADGRPILSIPAKRLVEIVLGVSPDCLIIPAHAWTPWFSVFGASSGFDSLEECFGEYSKNIFAIETGLSSDPAMNWRLSALDKVSLISCSDAHSPSKIGREACVFDTELTYRDIVKAIKKKDNSQFLYTIEFFPEEGKYHYDGHRICNIRWSPEETQKHKNICPVCKKPLTIGVMNRVAALADRPAGHTPAGAIPFKNLVPLEEIISEAVGKEVGTAAVENEYQKLINRFGDEFTVLLETPPEDLNRFTPPRIAEGIKRVREGRIKVNPGYDGVYGEITIFGAEEKKEAQMGLFR